MTRKELATRRTRFLTATVIGLVSLGITFVLSAADRPNIIVVLVDDMGYSDLGAYGGEVETPFMDELAKKGLRFTENYNSARCCPSRASLLTGLYSQQAGIADFTGTDQSAKRGPAYRGKLSKSCITLAEVLKATGYSTYGIGKWHVGEEESPESGLLAAAVFHPSVFLMRRTSAWHGW